MTEETKKKKTFSAVTRSALGVHFPGKRIERDARRVIEALAVVMHESCLTTMDETSRILGVKPSTKFFPDTVFATALVDNSLRCKVLLPRGVRMSTATIAALTLSQPRRKRTKKATVVPSQEAE